MANAHAQTSTDRLLFLGWLTLFGAPLLLDYAVDRRQAGEPEGFTFSEATRSVLREIPHGDKVFFAVATGGYLWYIDHILRNL